MSKSKGHWTRPKGKVYDYNYDFQEGYYKPMVGYMDDKDKGKEVKPPGALTFAERVARDCPGCKAHHKPGEPQFHTHNHPMSDPPHAHRHHTPTSSISEDPPRRTRFADEPISPLADDPKHLGPGSRDPFGPGGRDPFGDLGDYDPFGKDKPSRFGRDRPDPFDMDLSDPLGKDKPSRFGKDRPDPFDTDLSDPLGKGRSDPLTRPRHLKVPADYDEPWTNLLDDPDLKTPEAMKSKDGPLARYRKKKAAMAMEEEMEGLVDDFSLKSKSNRSRIARLEDDDPITSIGGHALSARIESDYLADSESKSSLRLRKRDIDISETTEKTTITY